ncbi:MAG TPA: histidine kinase dimerization/phospho-acceptor domain-containing protein [Candidatus Polarisedimenticolia bacterium]|jgi:nitrogen-specific signal transduction histidine kinase
MHDVNREVLEEIDAAVVVVGPRGEVLFANRKAATVMEQDLTGSNLIEGAFDDAAPLVAGMVEGYRRARSCRQACRDLLVTTEEAGVRYYWVTVSGGSAAAQPEGPRVVMLQDISEPLTESPAIRKVFSQVNHDLRSPLTSIAGAAELLLSGRVGVVDGVQRRLVRIVEEGSQKMSAILARTKTDLAQESQAAGGQGVE